MSRTSRNTLMIGGALILIALLLFCGPLSGRFGSGGQKVDDPPSVAAGPPVDATNATNAMEVADSAALGALVGASGADSSGSENGARLDASPADDELPPVVVLAAGDADEGLADAGGVAAGTAATDPDGTGGGVVLPPISAGPPAATPVAAVGPDLADGTSDAVEAARAFDAVDPDGIGPASERFAPPVAAPGNRPFEIAKIAGLGSGERLPCDSPGSGCRNVRRGLTGGPGRIPNPGLTRGGRRGVVR